MTATTKTRFSETMLAIGVVDARLQRTALEADNIEKALLEIDLEPTDEAVEEFWEAVEAIVAAEELGTLGKRLAPLRDDGALDKLDAKTAETLTTLWNRMCAVRDALELVEDDLYSVIHYCGGEGGGDDSRGRELDLSDAAVLAALGRASREMRRRFPSQAVGSYEVANVLLGRDITAGEPVERDLRSGDVIRVGKRLASLARQGLVNRPADGCWSPCEEASDRAAREREAEVVGDG